MPPSILRPRSNATLWIATLSLLLFTFTVAAGAAPRPKAAAPIPAGSGSGLAARLRRRVGDIRLPRGPEDRLLLGAGFARAHAWRQ